MFVKFLSQIFRYLKARLLALETGAYIGKNLRFRGNPYFVHGNSIRIGNNVYIGNNCEFHSGKKSKIIIEDNVTFGPSVYLDTHMHNFDRQDIPINQQSTSEKDIFIEEDVWIGTKVVILQGVRVGRGSIIGASSVVTKDVAPYSIYAGIPAKLLRKRFYDNF